MGWILVVALMFLLVGAPTYRRIGLHRIRANRRRRLERYFRLRPAGDVYRRGLPMAPASGGGYSPVLRPQLPGLHGRWQDANGSRQPVLCPQSTGIDAGGDDATVV